MTAIAATGDLTYRSAKEADIHPDAEIAGDVTFIYSDAPGRNPGGAMLGIGVSWLVFVASLMLVPVLGFLTTLAAFVFGIGALALVFYRARTASAPA